jgi:hypothetical protein
MTIGANITKCVGLSFIIVGLLRIFNFIPVDPQYLVSFSLAAFCLLIIDLIDVYSADRGVLNTDKSIKIKLKEYVTWALYFLAVFCFIGLPFILLAINVHIYAFITDALTLIGLGLAIYIIGKRSEKLLDMVLKNQLRDMMNDIIANTKMQLNTPENQKFLDNLIQIHLIKKEKDKKDSLS